MPVTELSNEQRRQLIDAQQVFNSWRPLAIESETRGGLYWNTSKGVRYLYSKRKGVRVPLGRETPELAKQKAEHDARKEQLVALAARLDTMAPVNRALGLGRIPTLAAKILRQLDLRGLLGPHIIVAGTNALFAYETATGTFTGGDLVATGDADLLWDARRSLELAGLRIIPGGLMGILQSIDRSFVANYGYNATNRDGYIVDLITPNDEGLPTRMAPEGDLEATPMEGTRWLLDSPRFEQTIIAHDGLPLHIVAPEPRTFAAHKLWLSEQPSRQALKRPRDKVQADHMAHLAKTYLGLSFAAREMTWLAPELRSFADRLA